jgi:hypothetical protein
VGNFEEMWETLEEAWGLMIFRRRYVDNCNRKIMIYYVNRSMIAV